jgi:hypothetical protein
MASWLKRPRFQSILRGTQTPGMSGPRSSPSACQRPEERQRGQRCSSGTKVRNSERMDELDGGEQLSAARAQVAMKILARLWAVGGARRKLGVSPLAARGEAQVAYKFSQNFHCVVMAALHDTAEQAAA